MVEFNRDDYPIRPQSVVPKASPDRVRTAESSLWASANPVLDLGEPGIESDTGVYKVGDGVTPWADLSAISGGSSGGGFTLVDRTTAGIGWRVDNGVPGSFLEPVTQSNPDFPIGGAVANFGVASAFTVAATGLYSLQFNLTFQQVDAAQLGTPCGFSVYREDFKLVFETLGGDVVANDTPIKSSDGTYYLLAGQAIAPYLNVNTPLTSPAVGIMSMNYRVLGTS